MCKKINKMIILFTIAFLFFSCNKNPTDNSKDEKGKVFGYVFNKSTNEPMVNVYVLLETLESETKLNGYYEFNNIEIGQKILMAKIDQTSYGATTKFHTYIDTVNIISGDNQYDIYLKPDRPPERPYNPNPPDHSTNISITPTLTWSCSDPDGDSVTYTLEFIKPGNIEQIIENLTSNSYSPRTLVRGATYKWKLTAKDFYGNLSYSHLSNDYWEFTTTN